MLKRLDISTLIFALALLFSLALLRFYEGTFVFLGLPIYHDLFSLDVRVELLTHVVPLFPSLLHLAFQENALLPSLILLTFIIISILGFAVAILSWHRLLKSLLPDLSSPLLAMAPIFIPLAYVYLSKAPENGLFEGTFLLAFTALGALHLLHIARQARQPNPFLEPVFIASALFFLIPENALLFNILFLVLAVTFRFYSAPPGLSSGRLFLTFFSLVTACLLLAANVFFVYGRLGELAHETFAGPYTVARLIADMLFVTSPLWAYLLHRLLIKKEEAARTAALLFLLIFYLGGGHSNALYLSWIGTSLFVYFLFTLLARFGADYDFVETLQRGTKTGLKIVGILACLALIGLAVYERKASPIHTVNHAIRVVKSMGLPNDPKIITTAALQPLIDGLMNQTCAFAAPSLLRSDEKELAEEIRKTGAALIILSKLDAPSKEIIFDTPRPDALLWFRLFRFEEKDDDYPPGIQPLRIVDKIRRIGEETDGETVVIQIKK